MTLRRSAAAKVRVYAGGHARAVRHNPVGATVSTSFTGPYPNSISGLTAWWDAGAAPTSGWGTAISSLSDKSTNTYSLTPSVVSLAQSKIVGKLGGAGLAISTFAGQTTSYWSPSLYPLMHADNSWSAPSLPMTTGQITLAMVWTRPNPRQVIGGNPYISTGLSQAFLNAPSPLLMLGSTVVLQLGSGITGSDTLILWPGTAQATTISTNMPVRHTNSVIVRINASLGTEVWLNSVLVTASPVTSPVGSVAASTLKMLGGGTGASSQCWFHEAYVWSRSLTNAEIITVQSCLSRWQCRARKGAIIVTIGQSNACGQWTATNAYQQTCQGVMYLTEMVSVTLLAVYGNSYPVTMLGGHGMSQNLDSYIYDSLTNSTPSTYILGTTGRSMRTMIQSIPVPFQADIVGGHGFYSENDSGYSIATSAIVSGSYAQFFQLLKAMMQDGRTLSAANFFFTWISALPFVGVEGEFVHRRMIADFAAQVGTGRVGLTVMNTNTLATNPNGATYDSSTGLFSGGDAAHREFSDDVSLSLMSAPIIARALLSIGQLDSGTTIDASTPTVGGPKIASAHWEPAGTVAGISGPSSLVTVTHDVGTDLQIALQAVNGIGWAIQDGTGLPTGNSVIVAATSCVRVSATQVRVVWASTPINAISSCSLFYGGLGATGATNNALNFGRGSAVTDNASTVTKPNGWNIAADLGSSWALNYPLAVTAYGVPFS